MERSELRNGAPETKVRSERSRGRIKLQGERGFEATDGECQTGKVKRAEWGHGGRRMFRMAPGMADTTVDLLITSVQKIVRISSKELLP